MTDETIEDVEAFRARARGWIENNLDPRSAVAAGGFDFEAERQLQAEMFDAGFAGFAFPSEYGGAGLTLEHQKAFFEEAAGYVTPSYCGVSIGMLGATLLDVGSEPQKTRHLPAILRGDEIFDSLATAIALPNVQPEKAKPTGAIRFPIPPKSTRDLVNEAFDTAPDEANADGVDHAVSLLPQTGVNQPL